MDVVIGALLHALSGGRCDFTSVDGIRASRYEVMADAEGRRGGGRASAPLVCVAEQHAVNLANATGSGRPRPPGALAVERRIPRRQTVDSADEARDLAAPVMAAVDVYSDRESMLWPRRRGALRRLQLAGRAGLLVAGSDDGGSPRRQPADPA